jgi:biopolymer transport protein ExbB
VLLCSVALVACAGAKAWQLFRPGPRAKDVVAAVDACLAAGDLGRALSRMMQTRGALARLSIGALVEGLAEPARIEAALAAGLLDEQAAVRRDLPTFHRIAQIATACGLLGTITGLSRGYASVANADATSRATALAAGLSESLHCTAFGLLVSTAAIAVGYVLHARAEALDAELVFAARALHNRLVDRRAQLRWLGARAPLERASYREAS